MWGGANANPRANKVCHCLVRAITHSYDHSPPTRAPLDILTHVPGGDIPKSQCSLGYESVLLHQGTYGPVPVPDAATIASYLEAEAAKRRKGTISSRCAKLADAFFGIFKVTVEHSTDALYQTTHGKLTPRT